MRLNRFIDEQYSIRLRAYQTIRRMVRSMSIIALFLASLLTLLAVHSDAPAAALFAPGELLHYKGYVFGWFPVGDAWFEVKEVQYKGEKAYRFDARALGHYVIYTLDIRLKSTVDPSTLRSLKFARRQVGSEKREYEIIFDRKALTATYRRKTGKFYSVKEMDAAPWETRSTFPINSKVNDILYTLYFARNIGDKVGNSNYYWFVEKDYIWKARVSVIGEKKIDLGPAGRFDALRIAIEPDYSEQKEKGEQFKGLFGVEGSLEIWVDKKTRIPLIIKGRVPFVYILRPTVSVILSDYSIPRETK